MKSHYQIWAMSIVLVIAAVTSIGAADANRAPQPPVRVLLVTGGHEHELSFYEMFAAQTGLTVAVNPHPRAFRKGMARESDVLVLYDLADVTDEAERGNLKEFVESGKGVVVLHHAIADNQSWPWWYEEVVGGRYL